jgi:hypothetical protein
MAICRCRDDGNWRKVDRFRGCRKGRNQRSERRLRVTRASCSSLNNWQRGDYKRTLEGVDRGRTFSSIGRPPLSRMDIWSVVGTM